MISESTCGSRNSDCCRYQYSVGTQSDKYVHGDNKECRKAVLDIRYESQENDKMTFNEDLYSDGIPKIRDIDKPLVMIVGTGANTGKFDIQLRVREMF